MRHEPLDLPDDLRWSMKQRIGFALGAWFLLFLPGIVVAIMVWLLLSLSRASGLHL